MAQAKLGAKLSLETQQFNEAMARAEANVRRMHGNMTNSARQAQAANKSMSGGLLQSASALQDLQYGWRGVLNNAVGVAQSMGPMAKGALSVAVIGGVIAANWDAIAGKVEGLNGEFFAMVAQHRLANIEAQKELVLAERQAGVSYRARLQMESIGDAIKLQAREAAKRSAHNDQELAQVRELRDAQRAILGSKIEQAQASGEITEHEAIRRKLELEKLDAEAPAAVAKATAAARAAELAQMEKIIPGLKQSLDLERQRQEAAGMALLKAKELATLEKERDALRKELEPLQKKIIEHDESKPGDTAKAIAETASAVGGVAGMAAESLYDADGKQKKAVSAINAIGEAQEQRLVRIRDITAQINAHREAAAMSGHDDRDSLEKSVEAIDSQLKSLRQDVKLRKEGVDEATKLAARQREIAAATKEVAAAQAAATASQKEAAAHAEMQRLVQTQKDKNKTNAEKREEIDMQRKVADLRNKGKDKQANEIEKDFKQKQAEKHYRNLGYDPATAKQMSEDDRQMQDDREHFERTGRRIIRTKRNDTRKPSALDPISADEKEQREQRKIQADNEWNKRTKSGQKGKDSAGNNVPGFGVDPATGLLQRIAEGIQRLITVTHGNQPSTSARQKGNA